MSAGSREHLPPAAYACALASLDLSPSRLRMLIAAGPEHSWLGVLGHRVPVPEEVGRRAGEMDVAKVWERHCRLGTRVAPFGTAPYPAVFADDPEPPGVVFHYGDPDALAGPRVAVVGTRRCTRYGRDIAFELGEVLAGCGVGVVSGLALGIDAAAHRGALAAGGAPPIGVVANGVDVPYPRANSTLWWAVAEAGILLGEVACGRPPLPWRFPARNRLIAALADVVVVVESHQTGGSLSTVDEATRRQRPVLAVPGPIRSPASAGTNQLLAEGCAPVCQPDDVLIALGLSPGRRRPSGESRPIPGSAARQVLEALGWQPATMEQLASGGALALDELAVALQELCEGGWIVEQGGWYERVGRERAGAADGTAGSRNAG